MAKFQKTMRGIRGTHDLAPHIKVTKNATLKYASNPIQLHF